MMMKSFVPLLIAGVSAATLASPAEAQRRDEHREVFDAMRSGKLLPVREIENRVLPSMHGAQYLGFDFDSGAGIYTLKFLRNGNVIWVEVDGHSGQIIGRSGR
ncbi:MAG: hypothetical protein C0474_08340 [Sphingobium sp.]|nr:hypothetical protein [Sphingobium sp.]